ncbi:putative KHG/KDPG aldolase isoform X2 [Rhodamnia argentea]|uniref:KHG/KDPG aldolase isoform X2 n=1 Tax=Rhodamnia argentea TaxID=178133 RepID=A0ABM3HFY7_9MYRT|nr:putative KHG/KDPG aldolase isoform X2 [Rhodamnia argentea]
MALPSASYCLWRRPPLLSPPQPPLTLPPPSRRHRLCACTARSSLSPVQQTISGIENSGIIACLRANRSLSLSLSIGTILLNVFLNLTRSRCECVIDSPELAFEAACAALGAGITVLEVVRSTPGVFEVLRWLIEDHPTATLGVGTILNAEDAQNAIVAGAKFLMSPAMVKILSAYDAGAKIVKVYPVSTLGGTHYISALKKPFPHIRMVASQGIPRGLAGEYIAKGASAVVLSDAIFSKSAMAQCNLSEISKFAHIAALQGREAVDRRKRCLE